MPPEPLKSCTPYFVSKHDPNIISTYRTCLKYENELTADDDIRRIRILGYMLLEAPNQDIGVQVAKAIFSCNDDPESLLELGQFFEECIILPLMKNKGQTPRVDSPPSRPSFDDRWKDVKENISEALRNHWDAKDHALIRDNWKCSATGFMDIRAPDEIRGKHLPVAVYTRCVYIIPETIVLSLNREGTPGKRDCAATILTILKLFHYDISTFIGEKVYSLINVLTMDLNSRSLFHRLMLYFEATTTENHYQIKTYGPARFQYINKFATFSTVDPQDLPVPSSGLLALHAFVCKVAHKSGVAEYLSEIYGDMQETQVLAHDGTSSDILRLKLLALTSPVSVYH